jgi:hypothetical protein
MFAALRLVLVVVGIGSFGLGPILGVVLGLAGLGSVVGWFQGPHQITLTPTAVSASGVQMALANPSKDPLLTPFKTAVCEWQGEMHRNGAVFGVHKVVARLYTEEVLIKIRGGKTKTVTFVPPAGDPWPLPLEGTETVKCQWIVDYDDPVVGTVGETWVSRADHCTSNCPPFLIRRVS